MGNCGLGNTVGVGGNGVTAAMSYAFSSGFSLAGGVSSDTSSILTEEGSDTIGIEAAYLQILTVYQLLILMQKQQLLGESTAITLLVP